MTAIALGILLLLAQPQASPPPSSNDSLACMIPSADSLVQMDAFAVPGWKPIPIAPDSVYHDLRLRYDDQSIAMLAGCTGDFDWDSKLDYAFLLKNTSTRSVLPYIFLRRTIGFLALPLEPVADRYGFDEDSTLAPGPCRVVRPTFYYVSRGPAPPDSTLPPGRDYIRVGWRTYYWNGQGFIALWTSD